MGARGRATYVIWNWPAPPGAWFNLGGSWGPPGFSVGGFAPMCGRFGLAGSSWAAVGGRFGYSALGPWGIAGPRPLGVAASATPCGCSYRPDPALTNLWHKRPHNSKAQGKKHRENRARRLGKRAEIFPSSLFLPTFSKIRENRICAYPSFSSCPTLGELTAPYPFRRFPFPAFFKGEPAGFCSVLGLPLFWFLRFPGFSC